MIYTFKDIEDTKVETNSGVLFICGSHSIFNYLIMDRCRELTKGNLIFDTSLFDEFNLSSDADNIENLSFDDYMIYVKGRKLVGKWYCSVDYSLLSKKQQEFLGTYIKKPNQNGLLVVLVSEWKDIKGFKGSKVLQRSEVSNLIDLSWPNRKVLESVLKGMFKSKGVIVEDNAIQLFIMRMGNQYGDYAEQIDLICVGNKGNTITYQMMLSYLDGITNYAIDDFVMAIIKPIQKDKVVLTRKAYKILNTLIEDVGVQSLVRILRRRVDMYIEYRLNINNGNIPILVPYSVAAIQEKLDNKSAIKKVSDITFKRNAKIASLTTIKDWYYIKMLLGSAGKYQTEEQNLRALMAVIHRAVYEQQKLMNLIGIKDVLSEGLYDIDTRVLEADIQKNNEEVEDIKDAKG